MTEPFGCFGKARRDRRLSDARKLGEKVVRFLYEGAGLPCLGAMMRLTIRA